MEKEGDDGRRSLTSNIHVQHSTHIVKTSPNKKRSHSPEKSPKPSTSEIQLERNKRLRVDQENSLLASTLSKFVIPEGINSTTPPNNRICAQRRSPRKHLSSKPSTSTNPPGYYSPVPAAISKLPSSVTVSNVGNVKVNRKYLSFTSNSSTEQKSSEDEDLPVFVHDGPSLDPTGSGKKSLESTSRNDREIESLRNVEEAKLDSEVPSTSQELLSSSTTRPTTEALSRRISARLSTGQKESLRQIIRKDQTGTPETPSTMSKRLDLSNNVVERQERTETTALESPGTSQEAVVEVEMIEERVDYQQRELETSIPYRGASEAYMSHREAPRSSQNYCEYTESPQRYPGAPESSTSYREASEALRSHYEGPATSQIYNECPESSPMGSEATEAFKSHQEDARSSQSHREAPESSQIHNKSSEAFSLLTDPIQSSSTHCGTAFNLPSNQPETSSLPSNQTESSKIRYRAPKTSNRQLNQPESSRTRQDQVKKKVKFDRVDLYYFDFAHSFDTVPEDGVPLGMAREHSDYRQFPTCNRYQNHVRTEKHLKYTNIVKRPSRCRVGPTISGLTYDPNSFGRLSTDIRDAIARGENILYDGPTRQEIQDIRQSRTSCGCDCQNGCEPATCLCAISDIQCMVDRENFPCKCTKDNCHNPKGRDEFNKERVSEHAQQVLAQFGKKQKKPALKTTLKMALKQQTENMVTVQKEMILKSSITTQYSQLPSISTGYHQNVTIRRHQSTPRKSNPSTPISDVRIDQATTLLHRETGDQPSTSISDKITNQQSTTISGQPTPMFDRSTRSDNIDKIYPQAGLIYGQNTTTTTNQDTLRTNQATLRSNPPTSTSNQISIKNQILTSNQGLKRRFFQLLNPRQAELSMDSLNPQPPSVTSRQNSQSTQISIPIDHSKRVNEARIHREQQYNDSSLGQTSGAHGFSNAMSYKHINQDSEAHGLGKASESYSSNLTTRCLHINQNTEAQRLSQGTDYLRPSQASKDQAYPHENHTHSSSAIPSRSSFNQTSESTLKSELQRISQEFQASQMEVNAKLTQMSVETARLRQKTQIVVEQQQLLRDNIIQMQETMQKTALYQQQYFSILEKMLNQRQCYSDQLQAFDREQAPNQPTSFGTCPENQSAEASQRQTSQQTLFQPSSSQYQRTNLPQNSFPEAVLRISQRRMADPNQTVGPEPKKLKPSTKSSQSNTIPTIQPQISRTTVQLQLSPFTSQISSNLANLSEKKSIQNDLVHGLCQPSSVLNPPERNSIPAQPNNSKIATTIKTATQPTISIQLKKNLDFTMFSKPNFSAAKCLPSGLKTSSKPAELSLPKSSNGPMPVEENMQEESLSPSSQKRRHDDETDQEHQAKRKPVNEQNILDSMQASVTNPLSRIQKPGASTLGRIQAQKAKSPPQIESSTDVTFKGIQAPTASTDGRRQTPTAANMSFDYRGVFDNYRRFKRRKQNIKKLRHNNMRNHGNFDDDKNLDLDDNENLNLDDNENFGDDEILDSNNDKNINLDNEDTLNDDDVLKSDDEENMNIDANTPLDKDEVLNSDDHDDMNLNREKEIHLDKDNTYLSVNDHISLDHDEDLYLNDDEGLNQVSTTSQEAESVIYQNESENPFLFRAGAFEDVSIAFRQQTTDVFDGDEYVENPFLLTTGITSFTTTVDENWHLIQKAQQFQRDSNNSTIDCGDDSVHDVGRECEYLKVIDDESRKSEARVNEGVQYSESCLKADQTNQDRAQKDVKIERILNFNTTFCKNVFSEDNDNKSSGSDSHLNSHGKQFLDFDIDNNLDSESNQNVGSESDHNLKSEFTLNLNAEDNQDSQEANNNPDDEKASLLKHKIQKPVIEIHEEFSSQKSIDKSEKSYRSSASEERKQKFLTASNLTNSMGSATSTATQSRNSSTEVSVPQPTINNIKID